MAVSLTRKEINEFYRPPADRIVEIDVPALNYIVVDGEGDPSGKAFQQATKWLYATIIPLRKHAKTKLKEKFPEPPLETLYWTEGELNLDAAPKSEWRWRCMIVLAAWMDEVMVAVAIAKASEVLGPAPSSLRIEELHEGRCVQIMQKGSPKDSYKVASKIYEEYLPSKNLVPNGCYHEVYLTDPRRITSDKMRTIVRQPVA